jgi:hypothetical protein
LKILLRAVATLLVGLPFLAIAIVLLCFQNQPLVSGTVQLTPQDIEKAKRIIDEHDPRKAGPGGLQKITIEERDLETTLNYAASRVGHGIARVALRPGSVWLQATVEAPRNPIGRYLNIDAVLLETGDVPRFDRLKIGSVPLPSAVGDWLLREGVRRALATERGGLAADVVKGVSVGDKRLTVTYQWSDALAERARAVLVAPEDQARFRVYHDRLVDVVARAPANVSLATLLPPLFLLALDRGAAGDIVRETRAAIIVLTFYANGKGLGEIVAAAKAWPQPARRTVTLAGRDDFPKHFLISAAIAAEAGTPLADAIGVYKEIDDSRGGSGFSFNDIGADRAGTRFGETASRSPERARKLARTLAAGAKESDFMLDVSDLPEFMQEAEFKRRYGGVGGAGYNKMMATIEARVAALPVLR